MQDNHVNQGVSRQHFICSQQAGVINHHSRHIYRICHTLIHQRDKLQQTCFRLLRERRQLNALLSADISGSYAAAPAGSQNRCALAARWFQTQERQRYLCHLINGTNLYCTRLLEESIPYLPITCQRPCVRHSRPGSRSGETALPDNNRLHTVNLPHQLHEPSTVPHTFRIKADDFRLRIGGKILQKTSGTTQNRVPVAYSLAEAEAELGTPYQEYTRG